MQTITANTWKTIENRLEVIDSNKKNLKRGELKKEFERLSQETGVSYFTIRTRYYSEIKEKEKDKKNNDKEIANNQNNTNDKNQDTDSTENSTSPSQQSYNIGDYVKVKVTAIESWGVFLETVDGKNSRGAIHISSVSDEFISDLHDYFSIGDVFTAKIKRIRDVGIEFTLKGMKLGNYTYDEIIQNTQQEANSSLEINKELEKNHIENISDVKIEPIKEEKESEDILNTSIAENNLSLIEDFSLNKEHEEILEFMKQNLGVVSPKAQAMLFEMLRTNGVFKTTLAMSEVSATFEKDLGIAFLKEVSKKTGQCL